MRLLTFDASSLVYNSYWGLIQVRYEKSQQPDISNSARALQNATLDQILGEVAAENRKSRSQKEVAQSNAKSWVRDVFSRFLNASFSAIDPLKWWVNMLDTDAKQMAILALEVLCIPATSAPIERVFSQAGLATARHETKLEDEAQVEVRLRLRMSTNGAAQKAIAEGISICSRSFKGLSSIGCGTIRTYHGQELLEAKSSVNISPGKLSAKGQCSEGIHGQFMEVEHDPNLSRLEAFHANMRSLLIPTKAKPFNEPFLKRLFNNDSEIFDKKEHVSTVLVGCVPNSSTQTSLLQSLLRQWILVLHEKDEQAEQLAAFDNSYDLKSIYNVFAKLISAKTADGSDLDFFTNQQLFFSFMFNALFDVKLLDNRSAFSFEHFQPEIIAEKDVSFEEKLLNAGLERDAFYAVQVQPRDEEELFETFQQKEIDLAKDIIALSFWMELASKLRKTKLCNGELSKSFGNEAYEPLFDDQRLVSSIGPGDLWAFSRKSEKSSL
uniref:HAT C-terminal dimerisation domain-containing protein n=1 Tax=Ditylenchus dipsaci TaxID=166011 RepID=A0A915D6F3_9BILA